MKEYIEREALFKKVLEERRFVFQMEDLLNHELVVRTVYNDFAEFVNSIPAADVVERKRGEWILRHVGHGHYWECSECHKNPCIYVTKDTNFCPNCGADMREITHD